MTMTVYSPGTYAVKWISRKTNGSGYTTFVGIPTREEADAKKDELNGSDKTMFYFVQYRDPVTGKFSDFR